MLTRNGPRPPADTFRSWRLGTLVAWFIALWLVTAWHLLVVLHDEVFQHGAWFITICAAPPLAALGCLTSLEVGPTLLGLGLLSAVAVPFWCVARDPDSKLWYRLAVAGIFGFWLFLDFALAFES